MPWTKGLERVEGRRVLGQHPFSVPPRERMERWRLRTTFSRTSVWPQHGLEIYFEELSCEVQEQRL